SSCDHRHLHSFPTRRSSDLFAELDRLHARGHRFTAISEERGEVAFGDSSGIVVVIDPLDGSLNARRTLPSHSLSLAVASGPTMRSEEHTSELQSRFDLVCRL